MGTKDRESVPINIQIKENSIKCLCFIKIYSIKCLCFIKIYATITYQKLQELQEAFTNLCIENREEERDLNIKNRAGEEYILKQIKEEIESFISTKEPGTPNEQSTARAPSDKFPDK